jgi:hypothetical protein
MREGKDTKPEAGKVPKSIWYWLWQVGLPVGLGGLVYLFFRDLQAIWIGGLLPKSWAGLGWPAPDWVAYNLPDGLWLYSALRALRGIWGERMEKGGWLWYSLLVLMALGSEGLQAAGLVFFRQVIS